MKNISQLPVIRLVFICYQIIIQIGFFIIAYFLPSDFSFWYLCVLSVFFSVYTAIHITKNMDDKTFIETMNLDDEAVKMIDLYRK